MRAAEIRTLPALVADAAAAGRALGSVLRRADWLATSATRMTPDDFESTRAEILAAVAEGFLHEGIGNAERATFRRHICKL